PCPWSGHCVIAGFGVPGRAAADALTAMGRAFCVIELNAATVGRCAHNGMYMIEGDASVEQTLRLAGVDRASFLALTMPNEASVLQAVKLARGMNPSLYIMARCHFISAGLEAHRRGANEVVIEEQVVAQEIVRLLERPGAPFAAEPVVRSEP
ncbi:MAG: hypothetical protein JWL69_2984, partial [Phycisphaerales bacterium]|nr:hypothetical protein [Phycisphaerales bacterium]